MWVEPCTLRGDEIILSPLNLSDADALLETVEDHTFDYFTSLVPVALTPSHFTDFIARTLDYPHCVSLVARLNRGGRVVGKSSFMDIREDARGLEIGMTWIHPDFRGTKVNPEMKFLMLGHAFDVLKAVRVQLKTDERNVHSQAAIRKLGATQEGVLRNHGIQTNGFVRNTVMYSILPNEWPTVRQNLEQRLRKPTLPLGPG